MWPLEVLRASASAGLTPDRRKTSTDGRRRRTGRKSAGRVGGGKIYRRADSEKTDEFVSNVDGDGNLKGEFTQN